ncbi:Ras GTPase-activating protein [Entamoeba marina]
MDSGPIAKLFFTNDRSVTPTLQSYCKVLIKSVDLPQALRNGRILMNFCQVHGQLHEILLSLARQEIHNTPPATFIFRGNSAFTRIFFDYLKTSAHEYLVTSIGSIVQDMMKKQLFFFDAIDPTKSENENMLFESLDSVAAILDEFGKILEKNIHLIPPRIMLLIHDILVEIKRKNSNRDVRVTTFKTIFFLRFIFPALNSAGQYLPRHIQSEVSQFIDQIHSIVKFGQLVVNGAKATDQLTRHVLSACKGFISAMTRISNIFALYSTGRAKQISSIDATSQYSSLKRLLLAIKENSVDFKEEMERVGQHETFYLIFQVSTRPSLMYPDPMVVDTLTSSSSRFHEKFMKRLQELQDENEIYERRIAYMVKNNANMRSMLSRVSVKKV